VTVRAGNIRRKKVILAVRVVLDNYSLYSLTFWRKSPALRRRLRTEVTFVYVFQNFIANSIELSTDREEQSGIPERIVNTIGFHWSRQSQRP